MADDRTDTRDTQDTCGICALVAAPGLLQACFRCDVRFHLNPYAHVAGIDCGDAVLGPEAGVVYYCAPCLEAINDEVLAAEAASAQARNIERRPGWRAAPPTSTSPTQPTQRSDA